jgi:tetratricopeptide (TPR) repeat protein
MDPLGPVADTQVGADTPALTFGPYRLVQRLGAGGMGEVWLAEQVAPIRRHVALKVIKAGMDTAQVVARFEAERQALALMDHPAIATVFDGGTTPQGRPYFAMEYVKGEPITAFCDRQRLPTSERLELFTQVCEGVQHAHQKGVIHRDLKPSNVLVTIQGEKAVPKIIDFGIAKATARLLTEHTVFTELGVLIGTPEYMSPEQAEMIALDIDTRTDVYALGVMLYELLTGALPFEGKELRQAGLAEIQRIIREKEPARPSTRVPTTGSSATAVARNRQTEPRRLAGLLRGDLDWITMKALEKDRTRRYSTVNGLAQDIRRHLRNEPVVAGPPSAIYRAGKFVRRHRFGVGTAATLALLLVTFAVVMALQAQRIAAERDRANQESLSATQVTSFLVDLFAVSDPGEARGSTVTAREILDKGASRIGRELGGQPLTQAQLQFALGRVYTKLGLYREAQPLLEQSLATRVRLIGRANTTTLTNLNELANLHWYRDEFDKAETLYKEVIAERTRLLGPDDPATLLAQFDLASTYAGQSRLTEAEQLTRATLEAQRRVLGPTHGDTVASLNNLQSIYFRLQRYGDALPLARQVVDARRRLFGPDHPATLDASHNLATVLDRLGQLDEAERVYVETLEAKRRVLGVSHDSTSRTELRFASLYERQERYAAAEALVNRACASLTERLGPQHARTRECVTRLIGLSDTSGKLAPARSAVSTTP